MVVLLRIFPKGPLSAKTVSAFIVFPKRDRDVEVGNTFRKKTELGNVI